MNFITNDDVFFKLRILDKYMAEHKGFIAGGCFKNIFQNKPFKDIDIFFYKKGDFEEAVKMFNSKKRFKKHYSNENVTAFRDEKNNVIIELVNKTFGTPEHILSIFDFSITRFAYCKDLEDGSYYMIYVNTFFEHLQNNKLVIDGSLKYPISSFERSYRYKEYGFGLCRESKKKLIEALMNSNTENLSKDLYFGID